MSVGLTLALKDHDYTIVSEPVVDAIMSLENTLDLCEYYIKSDHVGELWDLDFSDSETSERPTTETKSESKDEKERK